MATGRSQAVAYLALLPLVFAAAGGACADEGAPWKPTPPVRVSDGDSPWLSPDGRRVVVRKSELDLDTRGEDGQPEQVSRLWAVDLATGKERRLDTRGPPDGWAGVDVLVTEEGEEVPLDGGPRPERLPPAREGAHPARGRSRDGKTVAWVPRYADKNDIGCGLHVHEAGKPTRLVNLGRALHCAEAGVHRGVTLAFSPDGGKIAFQLGFTGEGWNANRASGVVDLATGAVAFVGEEPRHGDPGHYGYGRDPSGDGVWDANGRLFSYVLSHGTGEDAYVASADGHRTWRVTEDGKSKSSPVLSPEGDRLAFWVVNEWMWDEPLPFPRPTRIALRVVQLKTGEAVDLPLPHEERWTEASHLAWLPDGRRLLFEWTGGPDGGVFVVAAPPPASAPADSPIVAARRTIEDDVVAGLATDDRHALRWALDHVRDAHSPRVLSALKSLLRRTVRDGKPYFAWTDLQAYERTDAVDLWPDLVEAIGSDENNGLRVSAIGLLLDWRVADAAPAIRHVAETAPAGYDRAWALVALAALGDETAWPKVEAAARSKDRDTLLGLVYALRHLKEPRTIDLLISMLGDTTELVTREEAGQEAAEALAEITGLPFRRDPAVWATWWENNDHVLPPRFEATRPGDKR